MNTPTGATPKIVGGIDLAVATSVFFFILTRKPFVAATGALLVYDYLFVTFEREVTLVWTQRWTRGKVMFLLNRYLPFIDTFLMLNHDIVLTGETSQSKCLNGTAAVTWLPVFGIIIAEALILYGFFGVDTSFKVLCVLVLVVTQIEIKSLAYSGPPHGCIKQTWPSKIIILGFVLLVFSETEIHSHSGYDRGKGVETK
ncbi:hypothetical protein BD410DRAFT_807196 [Rickenella mellea]|uniref:DUF6533 domain-containing protein n=1 Tax=Rickenella mellea TaxID=50990 RepID=A0A4Y7PRC6_9AGAM|nr:hypothetical protein BD410DRAFT_807196 [Rickenella mellea]